MVKLKRIFAIGASSIPGEYIIPKLLTAIVSRVPEIELRVDIANSHIIFDRVRKGEYPLGIIGTKYDSSEVVYQTVVSSDRLVVIAPASHPLAGRAGLRPVDLKGLGFIAREKGSGTRSTYERAFQEAGVAPSDLDLVAEVSTAEGVVRGVAAGAGIAVVSELIAREAIQRGTICILDIPQLTIARDFSIITRTGKVPSQDTKDVISVIMSIMK
ncbi:MAG TPA: LysR substrate-binding domain-containing protein [Nitrospirota bacterium]|nr:LysR substrate-binding domain-containing protein [Nitrospirota bacterium]